MWIVLVGLNPHRLIEDLLNFQIDKILQMIWDSNERYDNVASVQRLFKRVLQT